MATSENDRLLLVGAGGHGKVVLETLKQRYAVDELGVVDPQYAIGDTLLGVRVVGCDDDLPALFTQGWKKAALGIGFISSNEARRRLTRILIDIGFELPAVVDASVLIGEDVELGPGAFINKRVTLQTGTKVGRMCILNTGCVVEHDCRIADFSHISSGAVLLGGVSVGEESLVGAGSSVRQGITIGSRVIVGVGSAVVSDLPDGCVAYGNPCKVRRTNEVRL